MKPKSLCRSLIFWSGIFVMGFICWSWRDSMHLHRYALHGSLSIGQCEGEVIVCREAGARRSFYWDLSDLTREVRAFPAPLFVRGSDAADQMFDMMEFDRMTIRDQTISATRHRSPQNWVLLLPHWLILLAVILPWSGLLLWRTRRIRRANRFLP